MTTRQMERNAEANYSLYNYSTDYSLWDAYGRPSNAKARAWDYCRNLMIEKNGHGLKVISHNTFMFTAGFEYEEDGETKFMYITPNYDASVTIH